MVLPGSSLKRLVPVARNLTKYLAETADKTETPYILIGASAMIMHGLIDRVTKDIDINIGPQQSAVLQSSIGPHLDSKKEEAILVGGARGPQKAAKTKFVLWKGFNIEGKFIKMKADVTESELPSIDSVTVLDGIRVASVPLLTALKLRAIGTRAQVQKLSQDVEDLLQLLDHMAKLNQTVPAEFQQLYLVHKCWEKIWQRVEQHGGNDPGTVASLLQKVGITKIADD